ncbi:hypothetical protein EVAR_49113_1 [Eumeta japonica]|uniref:Uncharacterized protein n=1 Tax=Eumeta variegata TaxID=151549 RepID=A0A4C1YR64_EUMVA|nr:hypothetical protein EVAR_49113_1 [Eumeta japonica]
MLPSNFSIVVIAQTHADDRVMAALESLRRRPRADASDRCGDGLELMLPSNFSIVVIAQTHADDRVMAALESLRRRPRIDASGIFNRGNRSNARRRPRNGGAGVAAATASS